MSNTKEIIRYQIKLLNEKQEFLKNILEKLPVRSGMEFNLEEYV